MVLTSKFSGGTNNSGSAQVLTASLDFMVAPTDAGKKGALMAAYEAHKPTHMGALGDYFTKVGAAIAETKPAAAVAKANKPIASGSGF